MDKLLYWCAGVDLILIGRASPQDRGRYAMLGVFILATAALSGVSMFFMAGYLTTNIIASGAMASAWAMFIFSIDRYLAISITSFKAHLHAGDISKPSQVSRESTDLSARQSSNQSTNQSGNHQFDLTPAHNASPGYIMAITTRLIAAIFLSIVISIPVKLALFEPDINGQLASENRDTAANFFVFDPQVNALKTERESILSRIDKLRSEIQHAEARLGERYQQMKDESNGKGGSGTKGFGPYYEQAKTAYLQAKNSWTTVEATNRALINTLAATDTQLQQKIQRQTQDIAQQAKADDGLLNRYKALSTLAANNAQINLTLWLISLLFVFIEAFPVMTKASQKRDSYEKLLVTLAMEEQPRQLSQYLAQQESRLQQEISTTPFVVPNQYRAYLIMLGVAFCTAFPFAYDWLNETQQTLTPTLILYMFAPLAIILTFISTEMLVLRSRALWQSLKPAEDLNFTLQALTVLLAPLAVLLYLVLNPRPNLLNDSLLLVDTSPLLAHAGFWSSWAVCYVLLLLLVFKHNHASDPINEPARQKQIAEIEQKQMHARQAYRKGCLSLYALTAFSAVCGFLLYTRLPANGAQATFWQLQGLLTCIPVFAVIFYGMGVRVPITTLLSIANSSLKRLYTVSVIFFSVTATGMCLALLANGLAQPVITTLQDTTVVKAPAVDTPHTPSTNRALETERKPVLQTQTGLPNQGWF